MDENKIIPMYPAETLPAKIKVAQTSQKSGNGGGNNMDKYVTHEELNHAVDRLSDKMDLVESHIDTKFANQKVWFYGTAISIILATIAIVKFIH